MVDVRIKLILLNQVFVVSFYVHAHFRETNHRFYTSNKKFAVQYDLGEPVAGNFYLVSHDSRVDQTLSELDTPFPAHFLRAIYQANLPPQSN